ncbi:flagellar motor stator protein MotA (plasmid) [Aristophania vespae]|uniref:Flagellar motor stator protein MotA n=1 Tax=Aristophania vespae TaxID=2697033 RepID=A0A6P1NIY5_9PROT|nr:flagellar motor stator protein MotA [Aristophania vespae]QHI96490.1 flagellar motor stator protein MotA [Aristophania vespae]UMM64823.1 Motility protein A [Aristophania vespae]
MLFIGGLIFAFVCVFGSFTLSGGALGPLLTSIPFEGLTIIGSSIGIFLMTNSFKTIKTLPRYLMLVFRGPSYGKQNYMDLLALLYRLLRQANMKGFTSLEDHFESPMESSIFDLSPRIKRDARVRNLICDYLRLISMNLDESYQLDEVMSEELKKDLHEDLQMSECIQSIADALPALGIVAAVLGVINTMSAISKPPAILGEMIAGALVGTFLGVLCAYTVAGPLATRMKTVVKLDNHYYNVVRTVLVSFVQGQPPQVCVEIGRKDIPKEFMPAFSEVDSMVSELTR